MAIQNPLYLTLLRDVLIAKKEDPNITGNKIKIYLRQVAEKRSGNQAQADAIYRFLKAGKSSLQELQAFLVHEGLQPADYEGSPDIALECIDEVDPELLDNQNPNKRQADDTGAGNLSKRSRPLSISNKTHQEKMKNTGCDPTTTPEVPSSNTQIEGKSTIIRLNNPGTSSTTRVVIQPPGDPAPCVGSPTIPKVSTTDLIERNTQAPSGMPTTLHPIPSSSSIADAIKILNTNMSLVYNLGMETHIAQKLFNAQIKLAPEQAYYAINTSNIREHETCICSRCHDSMDVDMDNYQERKKDTERKAGRRIEAPEAGLEAGVSIGHYKKAVVSSLPISTIERINELIDSINSGDTTEYPARKALFKGLVPASYARIIDPTYKIKRDQDYLEPFARWANTQLLKNFLSIEETHSAFFRRHGECVQMLINELHPKSGAVECEDQN